jgi:hypothetical protein
MKYFWIAWILFAMPAVGADRELSGEEIRQLLQDVTLTAVDNGRSVTQIFQKSGLTLYGVDGQQSQGFWRVENDRYCSQWPPHDLWDCYTIARDGSTVVFISSQGKRYPMTLPAPSK